MIIDIAHTKGGVGKSTIATNLAVEMNADLLDLDTQNSSICFSQLGPKRNTKFIKGQDLNDDDLGRLSKYKGSKRKHLIIDSGGYDSRKVRRMLIYSDIVITPVAASQVEMLGLLNFDKLMQIIKTAAPEIQAYILFNRVTRFQAKDIKSFSEYIEQNVTDYEILKTQIGDRKAYKDAFASGLSVCELKTKSQAADEIRSLRAEILEIAGEIKNAT